MTMEDVFEENLRDAALRFNLDDEAVSRIRDKAIKFCVSTSWTGSILTVYYERGNPVVETYRIDQLIIL